MKKVFYIEQEEFLRNALELCFPGECFSLESSNDCFHFLLDVNPKVIVLDAESSDLRGGSFIKLLREDDKVSELPIVVTGKEKSWQDYESKIKVSKYFSKPFSLSDLKSYLIKLTND